MLAMHRLLLYALAAMNGGPFSSDPVVQEDYISPLPGALRRSLINAVWVDARQTMTTRMSDTQTQNRLTRHTASWAATHPEA